MKVEAKSLRDKSALAKMPDCPGCYKWWAKEKEFRQLFSVLDLSYDDVVGFVEQEDGLYCIYVGEAINGSLKKRFDWHINQKHTLSNVKSGFLSTLRKSISSIVAHNQMSEEATNVFIDTLLVEPFEVKVPVHSAEARATISKMEKEMINSNLRILNIRDNKYEGCKPIKKKLMALRKEAKAAALT